MFTAGYWVDLADYKFDETTSLMWIHAMPLGEYDHPIHGKIPITPERVKGFADGVNTNVRGQDLDIDYDHKEKTNEAAGWVKQAEARADGLWLQVDWTKTALQKLQEKAYRYFSPEFNDEWKHPKTGVLHKNVLFGGGLTNRPFLKDILPINLSELMSTRQDPNEGGSTEVKLTDEQRKKFAEKLGLASDATEEQIVTAFESAELAKADSNDDDAAKAAEIALAEAKKLSETQPAMKTVVALMEQQASTLKMLQEQNERNQTAIRLSEVESAVTKLSDVAKAAGFGISQPAKDELRKQLLAVSVNKQLSEAVTSLTETIMKDKMVSLGEKGNLRVLEGGKSLSDEFATEVKKLTEGDKPLSFADAVERVAIQQPDLYEAYRTGSYAFINGVAN